MTTKIRALKKHSQKYSFESIGLKTVARPCDGMKTGVKCGLAAMLSCTLSAGAYWWHQHYELTLFDKSPPVPASTPQADAEEPVIELKNASPLERMTAIIADWDPAVDGTEVYITLNNKTFQRTNPKDEGIWFVRKGKVYRAQDKNSRPAYMGEKGEVLVVESKKTD